MEKIEKVVRRRNMESYHRIPSGFCIPEGKFSMETVCVDSSFIETKKGEKTPHTTVTRKEKV